MHGLLLKVGCSHIMWYGPAQNKYNMELMLTFLNRNTCTYKHKHMYITLKWNAYAHVVVKVKCRHIV